MLIWNWKHYLLQLFNNIYCSILYEIAWKIPFYFIHFILIFLVLIKFQNDNDIYLVSNIWSYYRSRIFRNVKNIARVTIYELIPVENSSVFMLYVEYILWYKAISV